MLKRLINKCKEFFFSHSLLRNYLWLFLAELFNRGLPFIVFAVLARYLGVELFGDLVTAMTLVAIFVLFTDYGLATLYIRDISRQNMLKNLYVSQIIVLKFIFNLLAFFLLLLLMHIADYSRDFKIIAMLSYVYVTITSIITFFRAIFKTFEKNKHDALLQVVSGSIFFLIMILMIYTKGSLMHLLFAYIASSFISLIIILISLYKKYNLRLCFKPQIKLIKEILKKSTPFFLSIVFVNIYYFTDQVLVYYLKGASDAGLYASAYKMLTLLIAPIGILLMVLLPVLSKKYVNGVVDKRANDFIFKKAKTVFILSLLIFFVLYFSAHHLIMLVYGENYISGVNVFRVLLVSWLVLCNYSIFVIALQALGKEKIFMYVTFFGMIINLLLNIVLIPRYAILGAAFSTVITEVFVGYFVIRNFFKYVKI